MNIHMSSALHRPPAAEKKCSKKVSFPEMTGMRNLISFYWLVVPTALGPISSCRTSETDGKTPGGNVCSCPKR